MEILVDLKVDFRFISATLILQRNSLDYEHGFLCARVHPGSKLDLEDGAFEQSAPHRKLGAMSVSDPSSNRKTETASRVRLSLTQVGLVETIKDMASHVLRHPDPCVSNGDESVIVIRRDLGPYLAVRGSVANRIVEEDAK